MKGEYLFLIHHKDDVRIIFDMNMYLPEIAPLYFTPFDLK